MATPLLTATHTLCIMVGDLHVENLEELIRITKIEELKDNYAVPIMKNEKYYNIYWIDSR